MTYDFKVRHWSTLNVSETLQDKDVVNKNPIYTAYSTHDLE